MNEFDKKALTWDDNPMFVERANNIANKIKEHIPLNKNMDAFEYGCGTGLISFQLLPFVNKITLADTSDGMLDVVRSKIKKADIINMNVIKMDLTTDNIPDNKFDLIYTSLTLHHINNINMVFSKFYMMLKKHSFLSIADLDKEDGHFHDSGFLGHHGFDRKEMKKMFETTGFRNVKSETGYEIKRERSEGKIDTYPVFIMTGEKQ